MKLRMLTLGDYQTNCYLVSDSAGNTAVIDPGYEPQTILACLREEKLRPCAILLTHGHFDHVGAVRDLAADTGCQVWLCAEDLALPTNLTAGPLCYTNTYAEGTTLHLAGLDISVLQTPGHTPGSVCLLTENTLFSGDTLFAGSCGRTDLPGGSWEQMRSSLKRLSEIEANLWVLPGHGESTMLESEKKYNPYLH